MDLNPESAILIQAARLGDLEAFNRLALEHQDAVYSFACRMLCDEAAARQATRRVLAEAYHSLGSYRGGSFRLWLLRIAARACLLELKSWRSPYHTPPAVRAAAPGGVIQTFLRLIPPDQRLALVLVDLEGLDYAEAAAVLDASPKKVQVRLAQARHWVVQSQAGSFAAG